MSISKKVFWIFLSVVLMIIALGITVYGYQYGNKRMHKTLHALLEFNKDVFRLRELQLKISSDIYSVADADLQKIVSSLNQSSSNLSESISGFTVADINLDYIKDDISNYYTAINEYSDKLITNKKLHSELYIMLDRIHSSVHTAMNEHVEDYEELEFEFKNFLISNNPESFKEIKQGL